MWTLWFQKNHNIKDCYSRTLFEQIITNNDGNAKGAREVVVLKPRAQENFPGKVNNHCQCGCMDTTQDQFAQDQFAYQLKNWRRRRWQHQVLQVCLCMLNRNHCWDAFVKLNLLLPLTIPIMQMPRGQSIMCYLFWSTWTGFINGYYMAITHSNSCGRQEKLGQVLGFRTGWIHQNRFAGGLLQL
jgi:hypothetical protein